MILSKIGLALGGGGARGAAHIGVLQELHKANIKFNIISGTSAGSVIGAMYAATCDPFWIEERFKKFIDSRPFSGLHIKKILKDRNPDSVIDQVTKKLSDHFVLLVGLNRSSIIKKKRLKKAISFLVPCKSFEELKIPLKIVSTDLNSGNDIISSTGDLAEAIVQSCSIPGFVEPTKLSKSIIVDGGVSMPIPITALENECDFSIVVDISNYDIRPMKKINIIEILKRSETITSLRLKSRLAKKADFLIRPNTFGLHWSDFGKFDDLIESGKVAARENIKKLEFSIEQNFSLFNKVKQWLS